MRTSDGYTFTIANYSPLLVTYTAAADVGTAVVNVFGQVTVTGLAAGASATTTVTATRAGYTTTTGVATESALEAGTVPTFTVPVRTAGGYTFTISNADPLVTYTAAASSGSASVDSSGVVTVTGLAAGASATTTVTATRAGYTTTTGVATESALEAGTTPTASASSTQSAIAWQGSSRLSEQPVKVHGKQSAEGEVTVARKSDTVVPLAGGPTVARSHQATLRRSLQPTSESYARGLWSLVAALILAMTMVPPLVLWKRRRKE